VPAPLPSSADVRLRSVELRWGVEVAGIGATREVEDAVEWAVDCLGRAGVSVERGLPSPLDEAGDLYSRLRPPIRWRRSGTSRRGERTCSRT
jgi:hypothetical protein